MTPGTMSHTTPSAPSTPRRITIREAGFADLPALVELEAGSFDNPWTGRLLKAELDQPTSLALLATGEGGAALGYAAFRRAADDAELVRIAVDPGARRQGVGRRLVEDGIERLRRAGGRRCFLEVRQANEPARRLYAALEFHRVGFRRAYYADGSDAVVLALELGPPKPSSPP